MHRKISIRSLLVGVATVSVVVVLYIGWSFWRFQEDTLGLRDREVRLDYVAQDLLATIGYNGMIHNFKNCVLRPDLPRYCDQAEVDATRAQGLIDEIEAMSADSETDLTPIRDTVEAYRAKIGTIREDHANGVPITDIDVDVGVDDSPAARALRDAIEEARSQIEALVVRVSQAYFMPATAGLGLVIVLLGMFVYLSRLELRSIRDKQEKLDAVFSSISGGLFGLDRAGQIKLINPTGRALLQKHGVRMPGAWPATLRFESPHRDSENYRGDPVQRMLAGERLHGEIHLLKHDDSTDAPRYMRLTSAPLTEATTGLSHVLILVDVTDQEQHRQQIERSSRLDALGQLTSGIAHDFNNLLATILYAVDLAQREPQTDRAGKLLGRVMGTVERARKLTDRLLAFGLRHPGNAQSRQLREIYQEVAVLARAAVGEDIDLIFGTDGEELLVHCDQAQLENALLNLLINSRDAIRDSGMGRKIVVSARGVVADHAQLRHYDDLQREIDVKAERFVEISVTDDGPGMSEEVRRRATDPFFTMKPRGRGSGLGLAMVYGFVQQSHGLLHIYTTPDHGTTVRMTLPRGTEDDRREAPVTRPGPELGNGETVLLVEDETDLLDVMTIVLEDLDYRVETAETGKIAWEMITANPSCCDLVLSDVVMPGGMSGIDLCNRIIADYPGIPVVLMSGYAGLSQTKDDFPDVPILQKPCMREELARALRDALSRRAG